MEKISIYQFKTFQDYITEKSKEVTARHSVSNLARRVGYSSHSTLSMVFSGKRLPSEPLMEQLGELFQHNPNEQYYFRLLVRKCRKRIPSHLKLEIESELAAINPLLREQIPIDEPLLKHL